MNLLMGWNLEPGHEIHHSIQGTAIKANDKSLTSLVPKEALNTVHRYITA